MSNRRTALAMAAAALAVLTVAACGSDRAGVSTAPSSVATTAAANAPSSIFHPQGDHGSPNERLSGESRVTSIIGSTSCPTLSFMMGSFTVSVDGNTVYDRGACGDIVVGARLRVTGARQADNSILATSIEVKSDDDGDHHNEPVEGEGIITGLRTGTSCPALTFLIGTKAVTVSDSTVFERGACEDLTIGRRVHVKGSMTGDEIVAARVEIQSDSPGHPVVEGDGRVTSLVAATSCPTLQFEAEEEWTVTLDAHTVFVGGACSDIAVGRKVGVKGTVTAEHEVLATQIVFKGPGDN